MNLADHRSCVYLSDGKVISKSDIPLLQKKKTRKKTESSLWSRATSGVTCIISPRLPVTPDIWTPPILLHNTQPILLKYITCTCTCTSTLVHHRYTHIWYHQ